MNCTFDKANFTILYRINFKGRFLIAGHVSIEVYSNFLIADLITEANAPAAVHVYHSTLYYWTSTFRDNTNQMCGIDHILVPALSKILVPVLYTLH